MKRFVALVGGAVLGLAVLASPSTAQEGAGLLCRPDDHGRGTIV